MAEDSVPAVRVRGEGRPAREAAASGRRACVLLQLAGRRAVTQPAKSWARAAPQTTVQPSCGFRFPGFAVRWLRPRPGPAGEPPRGSGVEGLGGTGASSGCLGSANRSPPQK